MGVGDFAETHKRRLFVTAVIIGPKIGHFLTRWPSVAILVHELRAN